MKTIPGTKIFKTRDSATSCLRKLGIKSNKYNSFIQILDDGQIACQLAKVQAHLEYLKTSTKPAVTKPAVTKPAVTKPAVTKPAVTKPAVTKPAVTKPAKKALLAQSTPIHKLVKQSGGKSMAETARNLILGGASNKEVWAALKSQFHLDNAKKSYPTWYRCELKRKGLMPG